MVRLWKLPLLLLLLIFSALQADETDLFLRLPVSSSSPSFSKIGISSIKTEDSTGYEIFEAKIIPVDSNSSLAITLYFEEKEFKTLRALWIFSNGITQVLSPNLTEGTLLQNKRTVILPSTSITPEGGTLLIQSDQPKLDLQAIHFQWAQPTSLLTSNTPSSDPHLLTPEGFLRPEEITGQPLAPKIDSIQNQVSSTVLVAQPETIDTVSYGIELEKLPSRVRLEVETQGLPVDEPLRIFMNGIDLGALSLETPSLRDPGYLSFKATYWGWRKGSAWIPVNLLNTGTNTLQLSTSKNSSISIKNLVLETDYTPTP